MREADRGVGTHALGVDVGTLLDQLVAKRFELGLDRVPQDQDRLALCTPKRWSACEPGRT
eukprot:3044448-Rhodomonas_salina.1